jgi:hypothetical protein
MFILYSSITGESVADLFAGGLVPGLVIAVMMIVYVVVRAKPAPENAPVDPDRFTWRERFIAIGRISPALLLILLVLGSIYTGSPHPPRPPPWARPATGRAGPRAARRHGGGSFAAGPGARIRAGARSTSGYLQVVPSSSPRYVRTPSSAG